MIYSPSTGFPQFISHELPMRAQEAGARTPPAKQAPQLLSLVPMPDRAAHDGIDDWDSLLTALTARLRSAAAPGTSASRTRDVVIECANDLDLLHFALGAEQMRRQKLESGLDDSNAAVVRGIAGFGESLHPTRLAKGKLRWGKAASPFYRVFR
ncbi:hypothetical protein [Variovorax boronicumulans]|uniref:hypothetical protein n=1 Tax=Variovorax boronicumulans TaxID=436515 RepID=UPI00339258B9